MSGGQQRLWFQYCSRSDSAQPCCSGVKSSWTNWMLSPMAAVLFVLCHILTLNLMSVPLQLRSRTGFTGSFAQVIHQQYLNHQQYLIYLSFRRSAEVIPSPSKQANLRDGRLSNGLLHVIVARTIRICSPVFNTDLNILAGLLSFYGESTPSNLNWYTK